MSTATHKALLLPEKFGQLAVGTVSTYRPAAGEILIKVQAAALNPIDWKIQKYGLLYEEFPAIVGVDFAGDVEAVGEGVTDFKKGDKVFGQGQNINDRAGYQQFVLALAATTAKMPPNVSYDEAATIPVALSTPYLALYNESPHGLGLESPINASARGKYAGMPIFIVGGAASIGQTAIQLAKLSGFSPIITTASPKNASYLSTLGADAVLSRDLSATELASEVANVTSKPITIAFDTVGSPATQKLAVHLLAPGGKLASVMPSAVNEDLKEGQTVSSVRAILRFPPNVVPLETLWHDHAAAWVAEGLIKPSRFEVLPDGLEGIVDGLKRLERNEVSMLKLIAHPQAEVGSEQEQAPSASGVPEKVCCVKKAFCGH